MTIDPADLAPAALLSIALGGATRDHRDPDPDDRIAAIAALRARLDDAEAETAFACRLSGESWAGIGARWGISRQAAHERFAASAGLLDRMALTRRRRPAD